jgi:hypothetical protein
MQALTWQQRILLCIFFGIIALSLLAPLNSNRYLPESPDFSNHVAGIVQAKMALTEGQFPLRTAPWQDQGWGNAFFQFYGPLPYLLGGAVYKWVIHSNPFIAYKIIIWSALLLAGIYLFRLVSWLTHSRPVAILASIVYLASPYLLININIRGDFTESIAQCLIPIILYYTLRYYSKPQDFKRGIATAVIWSALITTHITTFVYSSLFIGLFLLLITLMTENRWKNLIYTGLIYFYSCVLTSWYLVPIILTKKYLFINNQLGNPTDSAWLTPLPTLLSITAVSPMPLPGNGELSIPLYAAIGWPILMAVGVIIYLLLEKKAFLSNKKKQWTLPLLSIFGIAFFCVWSPINFWQFLPSFLTFLQFSYRLLTQTMWIGTLLFSFAILALFKKNLNIRHVFIGIVLISLCSSSWLPTQKSSAILIKNIKYKPDLGYSQHDYLVSPSFVPDLLWKGNIELPLITGDNWLELNKEFILPMRLFLKSDKAAIRLIGNLPADLFKKSVRLSFYVNNKEKFSRRVMPGNFVWNIPLNKMLPLKQKEIKIYFIADRSVIPSKISNSTDNRSLAIKINSLNLVNLSNEQSTLPVQVTQKTCSRSKTYLTCHLLVTAENNYVQLPLLYYPKLLRIKVDGNTVSYIPLGYRNNMALTGIKLTPGLHEIKAKFIGIVWANWLSSIAWILLLITLLINQCTSSPNKNHIT